MMSEHGLYLDLGRSYNWEHHTPVLGTSGWPGGGVALSVRCMARRVPLPSDMRDFLQLLIDHGERDPIVIAEKCYQRWARALSVLVIDRDVGETVVTRPLQNDPFSPPVVDALYLTTPPAPRSSRLRRQK